VVLKGDILYIYSLDRFGRNKEEILKEWNDITKNIQADIVVLDMPLLDTTQFKDSLGTFIADLVLQILSWMEEEERGRIRKRQREAIDVASQNGMPFGRPKAQVIEETRQKISRPSLDISLYCGGYPSWVNEAYTLSALLLEFVGT
jgi:DNA invertase Pin-like site-specific DNA recombinase